MPKTSLRALALFSALLMPSTMYSQDKGKKTPPAPAADAPAKPAKPAANSGKKPETVNQRVSYGYGVMIARQLKERGIELDLEQFNSAFKSATAGGELLLTEDEIGDAFRKNQKIIDEKNISAPNKETLLAGKKFLEANGKKKGIKTTASGLQYEVLKEGTGRKAKATDQVTVHYHGTLMDGTVFDSSVERGKPATFGLNQVIPGWTEGVQLMSKGAKYRFFIPYDLAYGSRGAGADIKPYSTLVFEVELLGVGE